ncbi:hypothetical protein FB645_002464 [Coemansia sp. IMI 203386]|nr:hypothetical protein FB645_002464 [Coemansia sp. IMI 203386]
MAPKHFAPVWQHYERHEPTGRSKHHRAICKFCSYELSGQPERMKTHLQRCTNCPQSIKDEFAAEENGGSAGPSGTPYGQNNFAISTASMVFERAEEGSPGPVAVAYKGDANMSLIPLKRRRSVEIASGAEGLAGLPWAPTSNASTIAPAPNAVPPAFQPVYSSISADVMAPAHSHQPQPQQQQPQPGPIQTLAPPPLPPPPPQVVVQAPAAAPATAAAAPGSAGHHESRSFLGVYDNVRGYYSRLTPMNKMQTSIGPTISPHPLIRDAIAKVPKAVRERFYGCGMPLPTGIEGLRVLDLGCGAGRDCYVAAKLVGRAGEVIGVDMTDEQLRVASEFVGEYARTLGYQPHLRFVKGYIEFLSQLPELYPGSIDLCISNNAVNLSPNKELVLRSVFEILKEGGEFQFSDIYADRRLPNHVRSHPVLMGECLGGALYTEDFKRLCQRVGFVDARQVSAPAPVRIEAPELRDLVGATQFYSITFRLFKFARPASVLEPTREDYGQVAVYRGTIDGQRARTRFDNEWAFEANRPVLVDGNTAVMLGESWLRRHFEVRGDRSLHFGRFVATPPTVLYEPWETDHELDDDTDAAPGDRPPRRRGILPLPTPFFINGLRQQGQAQRPPAHEPRSQSGSRRSSPGHDHARLQHEHRPRAAPPAGPAPTSTSASTSAATFPRLSSFSISQSNVRADGAIARSTASSLHDAHAKSSQVPRFILPVNRLSAGYGAKQSASSLADSMSAPPTAGNTHNASSSPSIRSGSAESPVVASSNLLPPPHSYASSGQRSAMQSPPFSAQSSARSPVSPSFMQPNLRQHSPASVATSASLN